MIGPRSQARRYALLALYQWQITGQSPAEIGRHFLDDPTWMEEIANGLAEFSTPEAQGRAGGPGFDIELFLQLLRGVPEQLEGIDQRLEQALDRPISRITPVELAILRIAAYELMQSPELPLQVIINEAIDLTKLLGADDKSHRYVNGVLDRIAREARPAEKGSRGLRPRA